jgi:uncharacterized protein (TIGR02246 family)
VPQDEEMKHFLCRLLLFLLAAGANAQRKADEEVVRRLPPAFSDAWAKHDGHELAKILADDVDFVTVATTYLHGRADFEKFHTRLLSGRFKEASITPLETTARFLRPDMAVVDGSFRIEGDKNADGTARLPRFGMMVMVAEKRNGRLARGGRPEHECGTGLPPELQDMKTPIPIPGAAEKP